ncbi:MAG: hypothetical protein EKK37_07365 [Sphingobacteriales bacterium]|nr:MAG: hypothetical protein EKK37_07365 [Sphingobacteriales bacterium]
MKTSNKILLGTLAFIMLVFTAIHVALYAKYKKGEFVTVAQLHEEKYEKHILNGVTKVDAWGINNLEIIPSDTFKIELAKDFGKETKITYEQKGDVLVVKGGATDINSSTGKKEVYRSYSPVTIYLPSNTTITVADCEIRLNGAKDTLKAFTHIINAKNTDVTFGEWHRDDKGYSYFSNINLTSNGGRVEFLKGASFKEINISLTDNEVNDQGFKADKIVLNADDKSNITLKGTNLKKVINKQ